MDNYLVNGHEAESFSFWKLAGLNQAILDGLTSLSAENLSVVSRRKTPGSRRRRRPWSRTECQCSLTQGLADYPHQPHTSFSGGHWVMELLLLAREAMS